MGEFLMPSFLVRLMPYIFLGIMLVLVVVGFILLSYLLIFGAILGCILFSAAWIKGLFSQKKSKQLQTKRSKSGQTIDHDPL